MVAKMLTKAAFLLLTAAVLQVSSEYIEPKFIEDVIKEQSESATPSIESRIVSGWEAVLGQHPHHANLRMVNALGQVSSCGSSIVHREWLITAAHCTASRVTLVVRGGLVSLTQPEYIFETTQYWNYPTYDNAQPLLVQPNDIGLVKLQRPVTYTRNLKAIRIQSSEDASKNYNDIVLHASGHGQTWTGGASPEVLRWVYLRGISNTFCGLTFGTALINNAAICAQFYNVTSQSTCQGDSGGPLVHVNADGEKILVGVTSFVASPNFGGCHSGMPAGFIRPGPFHKWFTEVSGVDFENLIEEEDDPTTLPPQPDDGSEEGEGDEEGEEDEDDSTNEEDDSSDDDNSSTEEDEDEDLSQLLKRLQVRVKVKVNVNQFRKKIVKKINK